MRRREPEGWGVISGRVGGEGLGVPGSWCKAVGCAGRKGADRADRMWCETFNSIIRIAAMYLMLDETISLCFASLKSLIIVYL